MNQRVFTICDVCRLVDGDFSTKLCNWCGACQSWICDADLQQWGRRARAMARKAIAG